jgi:hypothetical protein
VVWRADEEITEDLESGDPERIAAGLRDLVARMDGNDELELPPVRPDILAAFGDSPPEAIQLDLLKLINEYGSFDPPLTDDETLADQLALVRGYGEPYVAYQVALGLKVAPDPAKTVRTALRKLAQMEFDTPRGIKGVSKLVSDVLAGRDQVRKATVEALAEWPDTSETREVIDRVRPELTDDEREYLDARRSRK